MKICILGLLVLGCVYGAPVEEGLKPESCDDPHAVKAAHVALSKINMERNEGYIFSLHRLSNVHHAKHGENGVVYYMTLNVVETNCSVLSRKDWKECEARPTSDHQVYGQCKAVIFINKVHRVDRLYKYDCTIKSAPSARVSALCPDCPTLISSDNEQVQRTLTLSLDKFNKEKGLKNRFDVLNITRALAGMAMQMYYIVEYTIQETTCAPDTDAAEKCPLMKCEFAHKGFCKASLYSLPDHKEDINVDCEIYEPEKPTTATIRPRTMTTLRCPTTTTSTTTPKSTTIRTRTTRKPTPATTTTRTTTSQAAPTGTATTTPTSTESTTTTSTCTTAPLTTTPATSPTTTTTTNTAEGVHTHDHDHELALDHEHKHAHLHEHEHHHHHHSHDHETTPHDTPEGRVTVLTDGPMILPSFPDQAAAGPHPGVVLPLRPDPQIPGAHQPIIHPFPRGISPECKAPAVLGNLIEQLFDEDPSFKPSA
ncbi:Fetuin-B [Oryzias melastigma]|uniref:Fetuin-B n=1 Tax=Oryzias melastigma TaxID=30732 RepID=A0A834KUA9_ORYME|nr:Fetuin-B [Oryzias melastigma]